MPREKEKLMLKSRDYEINNNVLRAFYDKRGRLVFVLDSTVDEFKPNVLLVMDSYGDRKWDDVLSNDYGMDLELVRPKKNNKYQKLDVEYDGLDVYDNLISAYQDGKKNLKQELNALNDFRMAAVRRSANDRLIAATDVAENTRETIDRTSDAIVELQVKIKNARAKVSTLRRNVGKEPTKQSAAKILKAEAQLDVLNTKLERANKRLENANKRLLIAEDDIDAARHVLDSVPDNKPTTQRKNVKSPKNAPTRVVVPVPDDVDDDELWENDNDDTSNEFVDDDYEINTDVKPLFEQDPEIMDEKIAFKPINFDDAPDDTNAVKQKTDATVKNVRQTVSANNHKSILDVVSVPDENDTDMDVKLDDTFIDTVDDKIVYDAPVVREEIDDETPADKTTDDTDAETLPSGEETITTMDDDNAETSSVLLQSKQNTPEVVAPDVAPNLTQDLIQPEQPINVAPIPNKTAVADTPRIVAAPTMPHAPSANVSQSVQSGQQSRKPNLLYYVLLVVLIALSVFALWLYQRSNVSVDAVPELTTDTTMTVETHAGASITKQEAITKPDTQPENPFIDSVEITSNTDNTKSDAPENGHGVIQNIVKESLDVVAHAANTQTSNDTVATDNPVLSAPSNDAFVPQGPEECDTDTKVLDDDDVNKPEYNVSQATVLTDAELAGQDGGNLCDDGTAPDANGCCTGEVYSIVDNQNVCCPSSGGDCFPPMF